MLYWFVVSLQIIQNTLSNQRQVTWNTGLSNNIQWVSGVRKCAYKYITCKYGTKVKYTRTQWCTHSIFMPCDLPCEFNQDISVCELCNWSVCMWSSENHKVCVISIQTPIYVFGHAIPFGCILFGTLRFITYTDSSIQSKNPQQEWLSSLYTKENNISNSHTGHCFSSTIVANIRLFEGQQMYDTSRPVQLMAQ